jgi:gluconolactonase
MKKILLSLGGCFVLFVVSCNNNETEKEKTVAEKTDSAVGEIQLFDSSAIAIIDSNAKIEVIARNYTWSEGPVWIDSKQILLFSDVPENKVYQWKEGDSARLYLSPSGYTGTIDRDGGEDGANGLALDKDGRLLLCQSGNRQVVRLNASLDSPKANFTVLSANYNGKKFNSPNDLVVDSKNNIYFTDPIYGLPKRAEDPTRELKFEGVYKISSTGKTSLLIDSIQNPNGIALSLDEKILYVASSSDDHPGWFAYSLNENGDIKSGGVLLDASAMKAAASVKRPADGFKIDRHGNLFASGPDGINILSPNGKRLALIKIYKRPASNCAFNDKKDVLYITADDVVLKVKLR